MLSTFTFHIMLPIDTDSSSQFTGLTALFLQLLGTNNVLSTFHWFPSSSTHFISHYCFLSHLDYILRGDRQFYNIAKNITGSHNKILTLREALAKHMNEMKTLRRYT